ncbi:MAG: hypothetical protein KF878_00065 [Planctomycetes bacterium]|nr:hypothetical protein [Planctomycetota bacterium]
MITAVTYERLGDTTRVYATSDLAGAVTYHWYLDGAWLGATSSPWRDVQLPPGDQARVDVVDTTDPDHDPIANAPAGFPARRSLWWVRSLDADASHYVVEQQKDGGDWATVARVVQAPEAWSLAWLSGRLDDLALYAWRVTPYDAAGNAGTARVFGPERIVRRPDAPDFALAFDDETARVTIGAAL